MNTLKLILLLLASSILFYPADIFTSNQDSIIYENDSVFTIQSYKEELSQDGEWIKVERDQVDPQGVSGRADALDDDIDGEWVWRPYNMDPDWSPYTNGYWAYTDCGWMWVSYYTWGWRTCHYGRWWWSPIWGWVWSPGFVWAPAWVVWMYYDGYCGWYPISPRVCWDDYWGWHCHHMRFHVKRWTFCNTNNFTVHINREVIIDPPGNKNIIDKAVFVSDINVKDKKVVNKGPDKKIIEEATGKKIATEDASKYNNVKVVASKDSEMKQGEKKSYDVNEKNRNNDEGNKESYEKKDRNTGTPKKDDGSKNTDTPKKNDGSKNNDGVKKETKSPPPKQYNPPPQDPPKQYNPPPVKKQDPPPPPPKKGESKTEDVGTDSQRK